MYLKNQTYYHFHRNNKYSSLWRVGNLIDITTKQLNEYSNFYNEAYFYYPFQNLNLLPLELLQKTMEVSDQFSEQELCSRLNFLQTVVKEIAIYLRENVFEQVRSQYFSNLPSRKTCIWVFERDALDYWDSVISGEKKLFKLQLTGVIHKADQRHLVTEILPENILRRYAFDYWTGSDGKNHDEEELLFEGIATVVEEMESPSP